MSTALARRLRGSFRAALDRLPQATVLPILSGPLRGKRWLLRSGNYSCWLGTYERNKQRLFAAEVSTGQVVYDIGAHVGLYSLIAATKVGPTGVVVAFEPLSDNARLLRRNLALNHLRVEVVEAAIGDKLGEGGFQPGPNSYTGKLAPSGKSVPIISLDSYRQGTGSFCPNVLKIDVEGAEVLVLEGARETLRSCKPVVFLALHSYENMRRCIAILDGFGYEAEELSGSGVEVGTEFVFRFSGSSNRSRTQTRATTRPT